MTNTTELGDLAEDVSTPRQPAPSKTIAGHIPQYFLGRVAAMALGVISFPLYTRLLSVREYGEVNLILKVVLLATVFSKSGIQNAIMRFYEEHAIAASPDRFRSYVSTAVIGSAGIGLVIASLFALAAGIVPDWAVSDKTASLLMIASGLVFIRGLQSVALSFYRMEGRTFAYNTTDVGTKALSLAFVGSLLLFWQTGSRGVVIGTMAAEAITLLTFVMTLRRRNLLAFGSLDLSLLRTLLGYGFPLIVYELASILHDSGDRFLIQYYLGSESLGYYSAAYNVAYYIQEFFVAPVSLALSPMFLKVWVSSGEQVAGRFVGETLNYFVIGAICIVAATLVTAKDALTLLASAKYASAYPMVPIVVLGLLVYAAHIFLNTALYMHKRSSTSAWIVLVAVLVNTALNMLLLPVMGVRGSAVATLISYSIQIALIARAALPLCPLQFAFGRWTRAALAGCIAAILASTIQIDSGLGNVAVRGTVVVTAYAMLMALLDDNVREAMASGCVAVQSRLRMRVRS